MGRVLYIVARERPLLCGYLMATVGARSADGHRVEIKLDERRSERRRQREARDPERRRGERRHRANYAHDLRSRGYATVIQPGATRSPSGQPSREPAMVWQARSTRWHRAARARGRRRVPRRRWGVMALLLTVVSVSIVVGWYVHQRARPRAAASTADTHSPPGRPVPPSNPPPARVVTTRSSGIVLAVDPGARTLVLQDMGAPAETGRLRVELAAGARVVLSERDDRAKDLGHPFKDTVIGLADVRKGDFVVVEMRGPVGTAVARSVVVTFRGP